MYLYPIDLTPYFCEDFGITNEEFDLEKFKAKKDKHLLNKLGKITKKELKAMNVTEEQCDIYNGSLMSKGIKFKTEFDVFENSKTYKSIMVPKYDHHGSGHFRSRWIFAAFGNGYVLSDHGEDPNRDFDELGIPRVNILDLPLEEQVENVKLLKKKILDTLSTKEDMKQQLEDALNGVKK